MLARWAGRRAPSDNQKELLEPWTPKGKRVVGALVVAVLLAAVAITVPQSTSNSNAPSATNSVEPTQPSGPEPGSRLTLAMAGDVLLMNAENPFEYVHPVLRGADIAFSNVESPLSTRGEPNPLKFVNGRLMWNEFIFGADEGSARALGEAGFDVVSLANNHMMDYGPTALRDTFDQLAEQGIAHAGAGMNHAEARSPAIVERNGIKVAFLAYVDENTLPGTAHFEASQTEPGLAFVHSDDGQTPTEATRQMLMEDIESAREQAHVVVASFHWGREVHARPSTLQVQLAHRAVEYGADVVVGHHPHVLQAVEVYRGKPIFYSLGNFVFKARRPELRPTGIAVLDVSPEGVERIVFRPAWIQNVRPALSRGARARSTAQRLVNLSRERRTTGYVAESDGVPVAIFDLSEQNNEEQPSVAKASTNPHDPADETDVVDLESAVPGIVVELRYATEENVFRRAMYRENRAYLRRAVAEKLREAQRILEASGVRLKVWDAYRPLSVQRAMWEQVPDTRYVAPPDRGSHHNRGAAVDVTLVDREGRELPMGTDYDDFSHRAHEGFDGLTEEERRNRGILRHAMVEAGFRPLSTEWWHYSDPDAARYELSDTPIRALISSR